MNFPLITPVSTPLGLFCSDDKGVPIVIESDNTHRYDLGEAMMKIFAQGVQLGKGQQAARVSQLEAEMHTINLRRILEVGNKSPQTVPFCSELQAPLDAKEKGAGIADEPLPIPVIIEESSVDLKFDVSRLDEQALACFIGTAPDSHLTHAISLSLDKVIEAPALGIVPFLAALKVLGVKNGQSANYLEETANGQRGQLNRMIVKVMQQRHPSFLSTLIGLSDSLNHGNWKSLRRLIEEKIAQECQSVETYLHYGRVDLANRRIVAAIKSHQKGSDILELIRDLSLLMESSQGLLLARDRFKDLFHKDIEMMRSCSRHLIRLTRLILERREDHFEDWCRFLVSQALPEPVIDEVADLLCDRQIAADLPSELLCDPILLVWVKRKDEKAKRAFWLALGKINFIEKERFDLVFTSVLTVGAPLAETDAVNRDRLVSSVKCVMKAFIEAPREWRPLPLGHIWQSLWELSQPHEEPTERMKNICALGRHIRNSQPQSATIFAYIKILILECESNDHFADFCDGKQMIGPLSFLFFHYSLLLKHQPGNEEESAHLAYQLWWAFMMNQRLKMSLLAQEKGLTETCTLLWKLCADLGNEEEMKRISDFIFLERLSHIYETEIVAYVQQFPESVPETFVASCLSTLRRELELSSSEEISLHVTRFYSRGVRIFMDKLLEVWNRSLSLEEFKHLVSMRNMIAPSADQYQHDPQVTQERKRVRTLILQSALNGAGETWDYFQANLLRFGFDELAGIAKEQLRGQAEELLKRLQL